MRISILTQPLGHNYGGLLQAYALQIFLKRIGHEVETLDRRSTESIIRTVVKRIENSFKLARRRIKTIPTRKRENFIYKNLEEFRDSYVNLSDTISSEKQLRDYYKDNAFDMVIVGSDQIWRPRYSPSLYNYFLDFLEDIQSKAIKISYAASFGVDDWEYGMEETQRCKYYLKKFSAVSVREESAVLLCKKYFDVDAELMVDPTLLLDVHDYDKHIRESGARDNSSNVLVYILDHSSAKRKLTRKIATALDARTFHVKPERPFTEFKLPDLQRSQYPPVEDWLKGFGDAKYVITDSYHGCIFSIIFNKPFIAIGNKSRGLARFYSLLKTFGLEKRLILEDHQFKDNMLYTPIDWARVNDIRKQKILEAQHFLDRAIG